MTATKQTLNVTEYAIINGETCLSNQWYYHHSYSYSGILQLIEGAPSTRSGNTVHKASSNTEDSVE